MKREARLLLDKGCDSLLLSIELFNRPQDRGRISGTLILLNHAFEMLLKAAIVHRGGRIREKRANQTIGFDTCVRRGLTDGKLKFLTDEQALLLQSINGLRDAAQHDLLELSEGQLYMHAQAGVTLFRDLLKQVFGQELAHYFPERALPVSTSPPNDLTTLFESEVSEIRKLLQPGRRRKIEAESRLRPLVILDAAMRGEKGQPSSGELRRLGIELAKGKEWREVFKGVSAIEITADPVGPSLSLRLAKKEGIPVHLVPEGTPGASVVAVKRVDELGFYNLGAKDLGKKLGLSMPKTVAIVDYLGIRSDQECYKEFKIGSQLHKRYSQKTIDKIKAALQKETADDIWKKHRRGLTRKLCGSVCVA